jgi:predicted AlkP superfamily phosphohydrolase/phosphomutase
MASKVVVIGLDGATFALLKPWMEQGYLPCLKSLVDQGVSGPLRSSVPPATVPAWQCFMTGKNPGKHGVTWFLRRQPGSYEELPIGAKHCEGKTLWELLSEDGKRSVVLNVPYSSAPPHFNGVLIGGFDTPPAKMAELAHPPGILEEIEQRYGPYQVQMNTPGLLLANRVNSMIETFLTDCEAQTKYQFRVAHHLLDRDRFDFVMFYHLVPDRIQHWLWYVLDATHPWHDREMAERFYDRIRGYYQGLDAQVAALIERLGPDASVIVMSDHGFGPVYKGIDLSTWLLREGYLQIKRRTLSQLKFLLWRLGWVPTAFSRGLFIGLLKQRLVQRWLERRFASKGEVEARTQLGRVVNRFFLQRDDIDWSRTKAYCLSGFGMLRLNLEGREPQGAVKREDYAAVRDELVARLQKLVDPSSGQLVHGQVFLREDIYHGKYEDETPDLVYLTLENGYIIEQPMALPFVSNRVIIDDPKISGTHRQDGILIAKGPDFRKGLTIEGASLVDLAPTILYLMGSAIPEDMDGHVLTGLFHTGFLEERPIACRKAEPEGNGPDRAISPEDQEVILERLKGLGYID